MKNSTKIDQLTSLRFFAASMIVIHHYCYFFGIKGVAFELGQGVSLFFVLSGFILTYVYPSLDSWADIRQFWRARIARIYPAYLICFLIGFWAVPYVWNEKTGYATLLLVQAWVPLSDYYFSYNAVAWSVSTEAFFYLVFPLLVRKWHDTWLAKTLVCVGILVALLTASNMLTLPDYGNPGVGSNGEIVTQHGLIYINPVSRIVEFVFGMMIASAWRRQIIVIPVNWATISEIGTIAFGAASMYFTGPISALGSKLLGPSVGLWLLHCGSFLAFGCMIFVLAQGRGKVSKVLCHPVLVLLGEISFSLYLVHQILLQVYWKHVSDYSTIPNGVGFVVFSGILLLSSYLIWAMIEMPGRKLILGRSRGVGTNGTTKKWHSLYLASRRPLVAAFLLLCVVGALPRLIRKMHSTSEAAAEAMTPASLKRYLGTSFGTFTLRGLRVKCDHGTLKAEIAWQSMAVQENRLTNLVHLIDGSGNILAVADYKQPGYLPVLRAGAMWVDEVSVPADKLKGGATRLAIGMYDRDGSLVVVDRDGMIVVDKQQSDWGGRRLTIEVDGCRPSTPGR